MDIFEDKEIVGFKPKKKSKGYKRLFVILTLMVLALVSVIEDSTLIYETHLGKVWLFSFCFGISIMLLVFIRAPGPGDPGWEEHKSSSRPAWVIVLFTPVAAILCFTLPLARGLPVVLHYMTAEEGGEMVVTVEKKVSRKHCRRGAYIEEFTYMFNNEICGISKKYWEQLEPGQKILLKGPVSDFGFTYK